MIHRNSNDMHFRQITTLLRRRWVFLLSIMLLGGGAAAVLGFNMSPRYTAKAQLLYQMEVQDGVEHTDEAAVNTLVELLLSPSHLRRLAMSLKEDPGVAKPGSQAAETKKAAGKDTLAIALPKLDFAKLEADLDVYKERQSRLIAVTFTTTDPETSAIVANRAVDLYLDFEAELQRERRASALTSIASRIPDALAKIDQAEGALREHRIKFGLNDASGYDAIDRQIGELARQNQIARSDLAARNAQLDVLMLQQSGASGPVREGTATQVDIAARTLDGTTEAASLSREELAVGIKRLTLDRDAAAARVGDIESRLHMLQEASTRTTSAWIRLRELEREASAAGQAYENLLRRKADLQAQTVAAPNARLVTVAAVPEQPSSPNPLLFIAPAVIASLLVGGMLAILFERLDQRLRSERDVEETLGYSCIGLVPKLPRRAITALSRFLREQPFASYTEAIRSIFAATRQSERTILVTSSARGEGNTTLVLSLAIFGAQLGRRVLVIDFDLRRPQLLKILGEAETQVTLVAKSAPQERSWEMKIRRSEKYGIDYLSLPQIEMDPLAVLSNDDFPKQLEKFRQTYDYILIDSAPVVGATETRLLASMVDRVLFTVRWGRTEAGEAAAAVQQLRAATTEKTIPISVVVNQVKLGAHRRRYSERTPLARVEA